MPLALIWRLACLPVSPGKLLQRLHNPSIDFCAQVAANTRGIALVTELIGEYGLGVVQAYMKHIQVGGGRVSGLRAQAAGQRQDCPECPVL